MQVKQRRTNKGRKEITRPPVHQPVQRQLILIVPLSTPRRSNCALFFRCILPSFPASPLPNQPSTQPAKRLTPCPCPAGATASFSNKMENPQNVSFCYSSRGYPALESFNYRRIFIQSIDVLIFQLLLFSDVLELS